MKARPALLLLLALWAGSVLAAEPEAPQTLPIVYTQPGTRFILRMDNRSYELDNAHREAVALIFSQLNYPKTKLLWDDYKRALAEKEKVLAGIGRAEQQVARDEQKAERIRNDLTALRNQLAILRTCQPIDVQQVVFLQNQIQALSNSLAQAETQVDKSQRRLAEVQKSSESTIERTDKARDAYLAALSDYEKALGRLREIATTEGRAL